MDTDLLNGDARNGSSQLTAGVDLYWIPLGAGEVVVRACGTVFEAVSALVQRRRTYDLYHSALRSDRSRRPIRHRDGAHPRIGAENGEASWPRAPVGTKGAGQFRPCRYEIRRWRDGVIPDAQEAIHSAMVGVDLACAERLLDLV